MCRRGTVLVYLVHGVKVLKDAVDGAAGDVVASDGLPDVLGVAQALGHGVLDAAEAEQRPLLAVLQYLGHLARVDDRESLVDDAGNLFPNLGL